MNCAPAQAWSALKAQQRRRAEPRRAAKPRSDQVARVIQLREQGLSARDIAAETGFAPGTVRRGLDMARDNEQRIRKDNFTAGSEALRDALLAAPSEPPVPPVPDRTTRLAALRVAVLYADAIPPAADRSPCPRCGTRGDLGCRHRAPCELMPAIPPAGEP